ncbi:hypothetical protein Golob_020796 [Gossypium lobatum]|uniref:Uncharacterized protein n=1 Tax=Gossypium lobatum TaxID=34289 RepID=A0A7J8LBI1_9ROSI|nr:hypothetical protein [Gossypium lobatum]
MSWIGENASTLLKGLVEDYFIFIEIQDQRLYTEI